ncbi:50S ribosomal protein L31 [Candidatus Woesearchaeota archaeon]|nr:50S ribosomal protein L31 [Candidatus Woesearchaeota archaeon]
MAKTERTYTIPLRKEWLKAPRYRRAKKAATAIKEFLIKHMKSEDVRLGKHLNEELWKHGIKNPPGKIKVNVQKDEKEVVRAEIFGKEIVAEKKQEEEKKGIADKMKETITGKKEDKKAPVKKKKKEEKTEEKKEEPAKEEKKEEGAKEKTKAEPEKKEETKEAKAETKKEPAEEKPAEKKE